MEEVGKAGVELLADFLALERARSCEDCDFGHCRDNVEAALGAFEGGIALVIVLYFVLDEGYVGFKGFGGKAIFDELGVE